MGVKNSTMTKLKGKDLDDLASLTKLSRQEIKSWYKTFRRDHPTGYLTFDGFAEMYGNMYPNGDATQFARNMFRVFDLNKDDRIDFREFIIALSVYSKGTFLEKANWIFQLYDNDNSGSISKEEMLSIVKSIHEMSTNKEGLPAPEAKVEKIFGEIDSNGDGELSLGEFIELAKTDNTVLNILSSDMTR